MGTNFYIKQKEVACCPNCGFGQRHIGKSSYGWHFLLRVYPEDGINTIEDWQELIYQRGALIHDEYKDEVTPDRLMEIITLRRLDTHTFQIPPGYKSFDDFIEKTKARKGFNNLLAHQGPHIVGYGEGPWDYVQGEFS